VCVWFVHGEVGVVELRAVELWAMGDGDDDDA
jgi:hypothetical protein